MMGASVHAGAGGYSGRKARPGKPLHYSKPLGECPIRYGIDRTPSFYWRVPKRNATASVNGLVLEKASLGCLNVWMFSRTRHSNGVPAMPNQLTESDRAVLAQLLELKVPKKEIARRLRKHR